MPTAANRRPPEVKVPWLRRFADLPKALQRGPSGATDLARAAIELAYANRCLAKGVGGNLAIRGLASDGQTERPEATLRERLLVDRVAYAIPVVARRVPWRADCLVQALAARRWLESNGVPSQIALGTTKNEQGDFLAHAWLRVGNRVVTGGDISRYGEFVEAGRPE